MANGTLNNNFSQGLTDEEMDQLSQVDRFQNGLSDDEMANLEKADTLRAATPREIFLKQLVKAPEEDWNQTSREHGIDPVSYNRFSAGAALPNLVRAGALVGGGALGGTLGGVGAVGGAGGGMLVADQLLRSRAEAIMNNPEATAMGLDDILKKEKPYEYQGKSFLEGAGAEATGRLLNPALGKVGEVVGKGLGAIKEPILNAINSNVIGKTMINAGKGVASLPGRISDMLMENVAKYSQRAREKLNAWGWEKVMNYNNDKFIARAAERLKKPVSLLTEAEINKAKVDPSNVYEETMDYVRKNIMPSLKGIRQSLGIKVTEAKKAGGLFDDTVKIDFSTPDPETGLNMVQHMEDKLLNYSTLTTDERKMVIKKAEDIMGLRKTGDIVRDASGKVLRNAEGNVVRNTHGPISYNEANDILIRLNRSLADSFSKTGQATLEQMSSINSITNELRTLMNKRLYTINPQLGDEASKFSKYLSQMDALDTYIGAAAKDGDRQLTNFAITSLMDDPGPSLFGRQALEEALSSQGLDGMIKFSELENLALQFLMRGGEVLTAGVKTAPFIQAANVAGQAGRVAGNALVMSHITPSAARWSTIKFREQLPAAFKGGTDWIAEHIVQPGVKYSPWMERAVVALKGRPILDAALNLRERIGNSEQQ